MPEEAPNATPEITPAPWREYPLGFFPPVQYKGPHTGETLSPEYISREFNALMDNIAPAIEAPIFVVAEVAIGHCTYCTLQHVQTSEHCPHRSIALQF